MMVTGKFKRTPAMITNTTAVAYMRASTQEQDANRARE